MQVCINKLTEQLRANNENIEVMSCTIQYFQDVIISKDEHIKVLLQKKEDLENELRAEGYEFERPI